MGFFVGTPKYNMLISVDSTAQAAPTVAELKTHLRVDGTLDDTYIGELKTVAIEYIEHETGRDFKNHTWDYVLSGFPRNRNTIELPRSPVVAVSSISYYDSDGTSQTYDSSKYVVVKPTNLPAVVRPLPAYSWPCGVDRPDSVTIRFTTGFTTIPDAYKHSVKLLVGSWYENREQEITGTITSTLKMGLDSLLNQLRTVSYA